MNKEIDCTTQVVNSDKSVAHAYDRHARSCSVGLKKVDFNNVMGKYSGYLDGVSDEVPTKNIWVMMERGDKGVMGWYLSFSVYSDPLGDGEFYHLVNDKGLIRLFKTSDSAINYVINYGTTNATCNVGWC